MLDLVFSFQSLECCILQCRDMLAVTCELTAGPSFALQTKNVQCRHSEEKKTHKMLKIINNLKLIKLLIMSQNLAKIIHRQVGLCTIKSHINSIWTAELENRW